MTGNSPRRPRAYSVRRRLGLLLFALFGLYLFDRYENFLPRYEFTPFCDHYGGIDRFEVPMSEEFIAWLNYKYIWEKLGNNRVPLVTGATYHGDRDDVLLNATKKTVHAIWERIPEEVRGPDPSSTRSRFTFADSGKTYPGLDCRVMAPYITGEYRKFLPPEVVIPPPPIRGKETR